METLKTTCQMINTGDYLTSIDLSDAFLHVLIHHASRRYLRFQWENNTFQFRVLPFGLSLSPLVFTKILRPVLKWARRKGIRLAAYLDDILIVAKDQATSKKHTHLVLSKLRELGFLVKLSKSSLVPQQQIQHLGFQIDSAQMTLKVPKEKVRDLRRDALRMLHTGKSTIRQVASFVGKAQSLTAAVFPARLKSRYLMMAKNQALRHTNDWSHACPLTPLAIQELEWWRDKLSQWNGLGLLPVNPQYEIYTDASQSGWGIVCNQRIWSQSWNATELPFHINYKELLVIWKVVQLRQFQGKILRIYCDNTTTIAYVNKFGGTISPLLTDLATKIWDWCLKTNTRLTLAYVPTHFNPADSPSRRLDAQLEWQISKEYFNYLNKRWGPHQVDLFASPSNHHLPRFVTWRPHPTAMRTDALSFQWTNLGRVYACPPWNLIMPVINKARQEHTNMTLITPLWTSAMWFPTIRSLTRVPPLIVPRHHVLPPPGHDRHLLQKNPHWQLAAWDLRCAD
jgi:hypothetical protein